VNARAGFAAASSGVVTFLFTDIEDSLIETLVPLPHTQPSTRA
jgi:hypothetical protein